MAKSKTLKKGKSSTGETVYLTIKSRSSFDQEKIKVVFLVKTSKKIIYQSSSVVYDSLCESYTYKQARKQAEIFFEDACTDSKIVQLRLF